MKAAWPEMIHDGRGKDEWKAEESEEKGDEKQVAVVFCNNVSLVFSVLHDSCHRPHLLDSFSFVVD